MGQHILELDARGERQGPKRHRLNRAMGFEGDPSQPFLQPLVQPGDAAAAAYGQHGCDGFWPDPRAAASGQHLIEKGIQMADQPPLFEELLKAGAAETQLLGDLIGGADEGEGVLLAA